MNSTGIFGADCEPSINKISQHTDTATAAAEDETVHTATKNKIRPALAAK
jgi:hypothetical protein